MATTQVGLIMEFFRQNPNRDIPTEEIVDWVTAEWEKRKGSKFRDPDRMVRKLAQDGKLIKIRNGLYRYDPDAVTSRGLEDFPQALREAILKRDNYRCVFCGMGPENGVEVYVDHIKPKDLGGEATLENGQTLCARHNNLKKNYSQTESGKRVFIRLYKRAKQLGDQKNLAFFRDVLRVYEKHGVNGHIEWEE